MKKALTALILIAAMASCKKFDNKPQGIQNEDAINATFMPHYGHIAFYNASTTIETVVIKTSVTSGVMVRSYEAAAPDCAAAQQINVEDGVTVTYTATNYYNANQVITGSILVHRDDCKMIAIK